MMVDLAREMAVVQFMCLSAIILSVCVLLLTIIDSIIEYMYKRKRKNNYGKDSIRH